MPTFLRRESRKQFLFLLNGVGPRLLNLMSGHVLNFNLFLPFPFLLPGGLQVLEWDCSYLLTGGLWRVEPYLDTPAVHICLIFEWRKPVSMPELPCHRAAQALVALEKAKGHHRPFAEMVMAGHGTDSCMHASTHTVHAKRPRPRISSLGSCS